MQKASSSTFHLMIYFCIIIMIAISIIYFCAPRALSNKIADQPRTIDLQILANILSLYSLSTMGAGSISCIIPFGD